MRAMLAEGELSKFFCAEASNTVVLFSNRMFWVLLDVSYIIDDYLEDHFNIKMVKGIFAIKYEPKQKKEESSIWKAILLNMLKISRD